MLPDPTALTPPVFTLAVDLAAPPGDVLRPLAALLLQLAARERERRAKAAPLEGQDVQRQPPVADRDEGRNDER